MGKNRMGGGAKHPKSAAREASGKAHSEARLTPEGKAEKAEGRSEKAAHSSKEQLKK
ncbi:MAG TPA: CsbD family protein [Acetobacteraceae bacterium]|nr:CsbD family protein [Acetobacteraceae bacterium]